MWIKKINKKKLRFEVYFVFCGEGLGLLEVYLGEFYYVNLINLNFLDFWICVYVFIFKLYLKYVIVFKVYVVIIELKMFNLYVFV